jgi:hypothetical protein
MAAVIVARSRTRGKPNKWERSSRLFRLSLHKIQAYPACVGFFVHMQTDPPAKHASGVPGRTWVIKGSRALNADPKTPAK